MELLSLTELIFEYLLISSVLLLIIGIFGFITVQILKIQGKAKLWICALIIVLPLAYPAKTLVPDFIKVSVPLNSLNFSLKKAITDTDIQEISNHTLAASDTLDEVYTDNRSNTANPPYISGIKDRIKSGISLLAGSWKLILSAIWVLFFLFSIFRLFKAVFKSGRILKIADPVTDSKTLNLLEQCRTETGLASTPGLYRADGISSPMAMGLFKPGIIIPGHLLKEGYGEGLRFTLLHELKHLKMRHNWWLLLESVIGAAYFFHPVIRWAKEKIHEELEHVCDCHVVRVTEKSASYADFLLNEIWQKNIKRDTAFALPFVSGRSKTAARIYSILDSARPTAISRVSNNAAVLTTLTAFSLIFLLSVTPAVKTPLPSFNSIIPSSESILHRPERSLPSMPENGKTHIENVSNSALSEDLSLDIRVIPAEKTGMEKLADMEIPGSESVSMFLKEDIKSIEPVTIFSSGIMAEKYLGTPVDQISAYRIDNIKVLDAYTILFIMKGGNMYLTRLSVPNPSLLHANSYRVPGHTGNLTSLTKYDRIQPIINELPVNTTGTLGLFYPFLYDGKYFEGIRLLKKGLLNDLVKEGAFK